jgi:hypothetical protein
MLGLYERLHGGEAAVDLITFCYEVLESGGAPGWEVRLGAAAGTAADLAGHRTVGRASNTVFFQVAADDGLLVVNRVHGGLAGLVGRWACVPALHDRLDGALRAWLAAQHPECRVYQTSAYADWVEFQRPALRGLPRVGWGSDLADRGGDAVDLRGFQLTRDAGTGTLQVTDPSGAPAAFAYLGAVPSLLLHGVDRLLATLSDPWIVPQTESPAPLPAHSPRQLLGRVVTQRATWRMPPDELPRPGHGASVVDFLAEVERWRRRHGLPEEVFLTRFAGPGPARASKPQWIGFAHPHVVWAALRQFDKDTSAVEFTEALPSCDQHWSADAEGRPVTTEFIGLIHHD